MNQTLWAATLGALLAAPLCALAQQSPRAPHPADPGAAVRPIVFESAFSRSAQAPQDAQSTPDKIWRAANDAVAAPSGHAGHEAHQSAAVHDPGARLAPAAAPAPAPAPNPAPAGDAKLHGKHH